MSQLTVHSTEEQKQQAHMVMSDRFLSLAETINTPQAERGDADKMMVILNTYGEQFNCSTASAYSRIRYNLASLVR